jgi:hypothetical protein
MRTFAFIRSFANPILTHASLLAAHGFAALEQPVSYVRILGPNEAPLDFREGSLHPNLFATENDLSAFGSYDALTHEMRRVAATGRVIVLDLPCEATICPELLLAADVSIAPVPSSESYVARNLPGLENRGACSPLNRDIQGNWWLLGCANLGLHSTTIHLERACRSNAPNLSTAGELRVLPYEVPAMSRAQKSSLQMGEPLATVRRNGMLLAWALMFASKQLPSHDAIQGSRHLNQIPRQNRNGNARRSLNPAITGSHPPRASEGAYRASGAD